MRELLINLMKAGYIQFLFDEEEKMETTITQLIQEYGFNSVLIAITVSILTGIIKMPIKSFASKAEDPSKYTKYITFLPLILGFGVAVLYEYCVTKSFLFTGEFINLWLTSSSLSLAIYAFIEKFIPNKKKILSNKEIKENQEMIDRLKEYLLASEQESKTESLAVTDDLSEKHINIDQLPKQAITASTQEKIILRGKKHD